MGPSRRRCGGIPFDVLISFGCAAGANCDALYLDPGFGSRDPGFGYRSSGIGDRERDEIVRVDSVSGSRASGLGIPFDV